MHRKTIRHYHEPGHLHELTFSCYQRRPLLNAERLPLLARSIDSACAELSLDLVAFVFMPEHVHLLVSLRNPALSIGLFLARVKQPFSKQVHQALKIEDETLLNTLYVRERPGKMCFRFWQEGPGFDRNLFSIKAILASLRYIHANPVKRGLCLREVDWKWSSARYYLDVPPRQQLSELPFIHGLPEGALL